MLVRPARRAANSRVTSLALLATRGATSRPRRLSSWAARLLLLLTRAVPPPVWALLVLFVVFPGPLPGAIALGVYTFGVLGRLFAEAIEELRREGHSYRDQAVLSPVCYLASRTRRCVP